MRSELSCVSAPLPQIAPPRREAEQWQRVAEADYRLCRAFAQQFGAYLPRCLRSQRVGWELFGHPHCALLLPDTRLDGSDDEWYLYYVSGESLFWRGRVQRAQIGMIVLAESADDWANLLRQALRSEVFDARYTVTPDYVSEMGDWGHVASGFIFTLDTYAPQASSGSARRLAAGTGATPEEAARDACRGWLQEQGVDAGTTGMENKACP